jgi:glycosyltransferase involved in cell wall biosynthesis
MRVLFLYDGSVGQRRSGPAIRCVELARVVAAHHEVTLAITGDAALSCNSIEVRPNLAKDIRQLKRLASEHDIVITQGLTLTRFPFLRRLAKYLVVDLYDPYLFEYLAHPHPRLGETGFLRQWYSANLQMLQGDFFLCANDRQRDYWLGRLCALGRLNVGLYQRDPGLDSLLAVVPFGIPDELPRRTSSPIRDKIPAIAATDKVLLWAGGIWDWLDPLVIIEAMGKLSSRRSDIKLVFLGTQDPNGKNRPMAMLERCKSRSSELGVLDRTVFFLDGWVPYEERQQYLLDADIGVSAHLQTVESRLSFRTRILDYFWTGLPAVVSCGDSLSELIERESLGLTVAPGDVLGWENAIRELVDDEPRRAAMRRDIAKVAPRFRWARVAEPLLKYCSEPHRNHPGPRFRKLLTPMLTKLYESWRRY